MGEDGRPSPPGLIPTLEQSVEQRTWVIGTAEEVAEGVSFYADALGGLEHLTLFPSLPRGHLRPSRRTDPTSGRRSSSSPIAFDSMRV